MLLQDLKKDSRSVLVWHGFILAQIHATAFDLLYKVDLVVIKAPNICAQYTHKSGDLLKNIFFDVNTKMSILYFATELHKKSWKHKTWTSANQ